MWSGFWGNSYHNGVQPVQSAANMSTSTTKQPNKKSFAFIGCLKGREAPAGGRVVVVAGRTNGHASRGFLQSGQFNVFDVGLNVAHVHDVSARVY